MGSDKALLDFRGQTLLERAVGVMHDMSLDFAIVGDPSKYAGYGTVVQDVFPGCGPLAGIHAALRQSEAELNFVLAVDMPLVTSDLIRYIFGVTEDSDATVVLPRTGRGFEPLCAVYRRSFAGSAEEALRAGRYKIDALFATASVRIVEAEELSAAGFDDQNFFNVNTLDDLQSTQKIQSRSN